MTQTEARVISHTAGDRHVERYQLAGLPTPRPTSTWYPVPHHQLAEITIKTLESRGYHIRSERWTLSKSDQRIFGVVDLALPLARWDSPGKGTAISLGIRSSFDKRLPLGIVAGSRVFVCSNLAFAGEISYKRKHTRHGLEDFRHQVESAIERLPAYQAMESQRFQTWMDCELSPQQADALTLALFESGTLGLRQFKPVMEELRKPTFDEFAGKITVWALFNRITTAMRQRASQRAIEHATETSQLIRQLDLVIDATSRTKTDGLIQPLALTYETD
jgi:hypothetical protein